MSRQRLVALAQTLVRVPSENPPGDTREVARALEPELAAAGFNVELFAREPGFVSVVGTRTFAADGPTLVLCGHLDVVPAGAAGWRRDPWGAEVEEGRLYGRGSLDMKGPVAALVEAARAAVESGAPLRGRLVLAAVADEEEGGRRGAGALLEAGKLAADAVLIAEPGDGGIVVAHRGMCFVEIETKGRSVHASMPDLGVSAVELMVDVLAACRTLELRHRPHALLGGPTVAVGTTISGGAKANIVPASCRATLDVRKVPGMTDESVLDDVRAHLAAAGFESPAQLEVSIRASGQPGETDPATAVVAAAARAFEQEHGRAPEITGTAAATDGWWFSSAGIPTIMALGPGRIDECHVVDESVDLDELERYARIYADVVVDYLADTEPKEHAA